MFIEKYATENSTVETLNVTLEEQFEFEGLQY
jgi:hypothetical protein